MRKRRWVLFAVVAAAMLGRAGARCDSARWPSWTCESLHAHGSIVHCSVHSVQPAPVTQMACSPLHAPYGTTGTFTKQ
jgi:hypothetical protein